MIRRSLPSPGRPWHLYLLAAACAAIIVAGITELGAPASSARTSTETVTAANGVVQTTVTGSGNVEPGVDEDVNFATSGTLRSIDVKVGQHVKKGQLIATLDRSTAALTLQEAETSLTAARDALTAAESGESSSGSSGSSGTSGSASSGSADATSASATDASADSSATDASAARATAARATSSKQRGTPTTTTPTTPTTTTPTTPTKTTPTTPTKTTPTRTTPTSTTRTTPTKTTHGTQTSTNTTSSQTTTVSATTVAQDEETVEADTETVKQDRAALKATRLYAPVSGTVAALADDAVGQTISSGTTAVAASSSTSSSSTTAATGASGSSTSSDSSSTSAFAQIINSKDLTMTVSLSESEVSSVHDGQSATVSITALSGVELAGHVTSISPLGSSSDGVVSYTATVTTDQSNRKVLPGMSASASIVTAQASGVTLPTDAINGSGSSATVDVDDNGKIKPTTVTVGLRGSDGAQITSGLKAGQQVQVTITLPSLGTSTSSSSSSSSSLTGAGAGGFTGGGAGFRAFFGGGGGGAP